MTLPHRRLGRTGLEVSAMGLGAAPLGELFEKVSDDEADPATVEEYYAATTWVVLARPGVPRATPSAPGLTWSPLRPPLVEAWTDRHAALWPLL